MKDKLPSANFTEIEVMKARIKHFERLQKWQISISGINFLVLLIMVLQLSSKIFG